MSEVSHGEQFEAGAGRLDAAAAIRQLPYFIERGAPAWRKLMGHALRSHLGFTLENKRVLEIGARYGKMSCFFGLLGAQVVGIDTSAAPLAQARREALKWRVSDRVTFQHYLGDLTAITDGPFDIVFTKSVLVVVRPLDDFAPQIARLLAPEGRLVSLENGRGPYAMHLLRALRHRTWNYRSARFFTDCELKIMRQHFQIIETRNTLVPPVILIVAQRRPEVTVQGST